MKKAARFVVQGTVQGVFFRNFVVEHALNLKLKGFTRNLQGGDIEVVAEGEADALQRLYQQLKKGPEHAHIRNVSTEERKWTGEFKDFKVIRF